MSYITKKSLDELTYRIIGAAIHVQKCLGAGLLENIYHQCLMIKLEDRGILFKSELDVRIVFNGREIETPLRCDCY